MTTQITCRLSGESFLIDERDATVYARLGVPHPTLCPDERQRRRMSWRNERNFYHRKCDACERQIISIYHPDSPYTAYCNACWWSDSWRAEDYAQDFDFSRPFFEQFKELQMKVPRLALHQKNSENSDYTNHAEQNQNCYLCVDTALSRDVYHSKWMIKCENCSDSYNIEDCQLCVESQYQVSGYNNLYNFFSDFSTECCFVYNCTNSRHCFMSSNQHRKEYILFNQQVTREAYEAYLAKIDLGSHQQLEFFRQKYLEMVAASPKRALIIMSEDCEGDCIYKCKNVRDSFDVIESRDCRYCYEAGHMKDCYDVYESAFDCELQYECHGCNRGKFLKFAHVSYDVNDCEYVDTCHNSSNLFACIGVRRGSYCILNKAYSAEAFAEFRDRIIEHMKKTGEWGEFFPTAMSPFAYNETIAQEYYPLSQMDAQERGYQWREETDDYAYEGAPYVLPDNIKDTPDAVCKQILKCEVTGKLYKIIPQELALYKRLGVALPRRSPQQRYMDRLAIRNPRHLWIWSCHGCRKQIRAPYSPGSEQAVFCQECYEAAKYGSSASANSLQNGLN